MAFGREDRGAVTGLEIPVAQRDKGGHRAEAQRAGVVVDEKLGAVGIIALVALADVGP
jgi:hypothetical protein